MKRLVPAYVLSVFVWVTVACNHNFASEDVPCSASPTGDTLVLDYHKSTAVFTPCEKNLHATITQITDSRCPKDVTCVWAGKLSVVLRMDSLFSVTLEPGKIVDTSWNDSHYSFKLVDVTPYPTAQPPANDMEKKTIVSILKR